MVHSDTVTSKPHDDAIETTTCAVVGGGPAGMVLGLLLARAGVRVTVFEKHGDFLRDFRGDTVHPVTLTLLDDLGLYPQFEALTHSEIKHVGLTTADGERVTLADFSRLRERHPLLALVPQWDLLDLLADAAAAEPSFTLRMNTEVTGLLEDDGCVVGVRYRGPDGAGELKADLTVACDGRTSTVRQAAGLIPREFRVPFDVAWFRLDATEPIMYQLTPRFAPGQALILIPREGYYQAGALLPKGGADALQAGDLGEFKARVGAMVTEASTDGLVSWDDVKTLDVRLNRLRRWHRPGLLCIGDAAHAMSPAGGVGINLAIADAVAAARIIAAPLRSGRVTEDELAVVQRRRELPARLTQLAQRIMHLGVGRIVRGGVPDPPPWIRRTGIAILRRFPGLTVIPAYLVGVGFRPERAPEFARRSPE
jgi:2-polyprenyl-6-methoxyphenol hydroxylase-like FAD-dependent oxidoreductase